MPILDHLLLNQIDTGIRTEEFIPGFVPLYELREACVFSGYKWAEWDSLEHYEQVACVAHFRMHNLVERHVQHAVTKYMERQRDNG